MEVVDAVVVAGGIGSVAATLLVLSGFGAVVVEARRGDALYGLHAMFFDNRGSVTIRSSCPPKPIWRRCSK